LRVPGNRFGVAHRPDRGGQVGGDGRDRGRQVVVGRPVAVDVPAGRQRQREGESCGPARAE
jgi:hypothetical protein